MEYAADCQLMNRYKKTPLQVSHNSVVRKLIEELYNERCFVSLDQVEITAEFVTNVAPNVIPATIPKKKKGEIQPSESIEKSISKLHTAIADDDRNMVLFLCGIQSKGATTTISQDGNCDPLCQCSSCVPTGSTSMTSQTHCWNASLHISCQYNAVGIVKMLLNYKVLPSLLYNGQTPLHICARYNQAECAKLLLDSNASREVTNANGRTALQEAVYCKSKSVEDVLLISENSISSVEVAANENGLSPSNEQPSFQTLSTLLNKDLSLDDSLETSQPPD